MTVPTPPDPDPAATAGSGSSSLPGRVTRSDRTVPARRAHSGQADEAVGRAYDALAPAYARLLPGTEAEQAAELDLLRRFVAAVGPRERLLDLGCGTGRLLPLLAAAGASVEGLDLSPAMVAIARRSRPGVPIHVGNLTRLPWRDGAAAAAVSWYSTIHLDDSGLEAALAEMRRVLGPGGRALVAFQEGEGTRDVGRAMAQHTGVPVALTRRLRTLESMAGAVEAAGFDVVERFSRPAAGTERDAQAVIVGRVPEGRVPGGRVPEGPLTRTR